MTIIRSDNYSRCIVVVKITLNLLNNSSNNSTPTRYNNRTMLHILLKQSINTRSKRMTTMCKSFQRTTLLSHEEEATHNDDVDQPTHNDPIQSRPDDDNLVTFDSKPKHPVRGA